MNPDLLTWTIPILSGAVSTAIEVIKEFKKVQSAKTSADALKLYYPNKFGDLNRLPPTVLKIVVHDFNWEQARSILQKRVMQSLFIGSLLTGFKQGITPMQSIGIILAFVGWHLYDSDLKVSYKNPRYSFTFFVILTTVVALLIFWPSWG